MIFERNTGANRFVFLAVFFVLLISRILVLTDNYTWGIEPLLIEIFYVLLTVALLIYKNNCSLRIRFSAYLFVLIVMLIHTVLWGVFFTEVGFGDLITEHFKPQIMFVVVLFITVWAIQQLHAEKAFLKCACYALSAVLLIQFVRNIHEVDLNNLVNIMTAHDRTRANFGFGHYNSLGAACTCNLILLETIYHHKLTRNLNLLQLLFGVISVIMLLCSASRCALTSLILYVAIMTLQNTNQLPIPKRQIFLLRMLTTLFSMAVILYILVAVDLTEILVASQRIHLFKDTLPMFLQSGKAVLGLGYASTVAYAEGLTPYTTHWLDNGYIYYLVTTGFAGFAVILSGVGCMGFIVFRQKMLPHGKRLIAVFCVYLYISLFEATLFQSGGIVNYIYLPWMLMYCSQNRNVHLISKRTLMKL